MTITKKTILMVIGISLVLFSVVIFTTNYFYVKGFNELEIKNTDQTVHQVRDIMAIKLNGLEAFTVDWSQWDDTYYFARDLDQAYIENNLADDTFTNVGINIFIVYNPQGQKLYGKAYSRTPVPNLELPDKLESIVPFNEILENGDGVNGIATISGYPVLISCQPILTSLKQGPSTGYLVAGSFVDASMVYYFSSIMHLAQGSIQLVTPAQGADFDKLFQLASQSDSVYAKVTSGNTIDGYTSFRGFDGQPAFVVDVSLTRDIYNEARKAIGYLHGALAAIAVIFCGLVIYIFRTMILMRLTSLSSAVSSIGSKGEISNRVQVRGKDELSRLAENINGMLESLEKSELRRQSQKEIIGYIMSNTPNGVVAYDEKGRITLINEAFRAMFGLTNYAVGNSRLEDLPDMSDIAVEANNFRLSRMKSFRKEIVRVRDGVSKIFIATFSRLKEEELYILYLTDISEERFQQESLYLTDRLASIGEMASGIAHELNNPLTSIIGLSEIVTRSEVSPEVKEDMEMIKSESHRAAGIVRNLLSFARKNSTIKQATNINSIINDVLKLRSYEHSVNNIKIQKYLDPNLPDIMVDHSQIQQVFINIILNAEFAMVTAHSGGTIIIKTETADDILKVTFIDDGPGIEPGNLRHIFDPFFTTKEVGKGTGLGLSISYGIVTAHSGRIYATSEFGKGATFFVELPLHEAGKKEAKPNA